MKLRILKAETIFQTMVSLAGLVYICLDYNQKPIAKFFIALFFVGVSNLLGFLLRVLISKSKFHQYYVFAVILFFVVIYFAAVFSSDSNRDAILYLMGIGGVLFNIYYIAYGFHLFESLQPHITE
ncbi:hypothetical protein [Chryseobacterium profundimaris]|uniref:Uncharacterized protein n=1 Tax=Chryseobacterium profundimaris TaxID=1387275 RepID=A0ABY1NXH0_9FLAO|nr:hypothetical protein [Chryseobacterium profundimaris]SMP21165.1 hypothetical protein SAMN06264346_10615 [Chryseobacterium profundimaris]